MERDAITDSQRRSLRRRNIGAAILFGGLFITCLIVFYFASNAPKAPEIQLQKTVLSSTSTGPLAGVELKPSGKLALVPLLLAFLGITCVAHVFYAVGGGRKGFYTRNMQAGWNPWRWLEYGITASLMALLIASLSGVHNVETLGAIAVLTALTMGMGLLVERALGPAKRNGTSSTFGYLGPTIAGWIAFMATWKLIGFSFFNSAANAAASPPPWVWAIFWTQLALFGCFGFIQLWQVLRSRKSKRLLPYSRVETAYISASFFAKATLASLLLAGLAFIPQNSSSAITSAAMDDAKAALPPSKLAALMEEGKQELQEKL